MSDTVGKVVAGIAVAIVVWFGAQLGAKLRLAIDQRRVRRWLAANTRDWPHESHVGTIALAKGTGLPEERVRRACMSDMRVYRSSRTEEWSVWRAEPESIYEKRGLLAV